MEFKKYDEHIDDFFVISFSYDEFQLVKKAIVSSLSRHAKKGSLDHRLLDLANEFSEHESGQGETASILVSLDQVSIVNDSIESYAETAHPVYMRMITNMLEEMADMPVASCESGKIGYSQGMIELIVSQSVTPDSAEGLF